MPHAGPTSTRPGSGTRKTSPAPVTRLTSPVLVGRAAELDQLRAVVRQPPAVIVIEGEAGIGKSRLIRDWFAEPALAGVTRLVGTAARCGSHSRSAR